MKKISKMSTMGAMNYHRDHLDLKVWIFKVQAKKKERKDLLTCL